MIGLLANLLAGIIGGLLVLTLWHLFTNRAAKPFVVEHRHILDVDERTMADVERLAQYVVGESYHNHRLLATHAANLADRNQRRNEARRKAPPGAARATRPLLDPEQRAEQGFREDTIKNGIQTLKEGYEADGMAPPPESVLREQVLNMLYDRSPL
jgi:hypothetical protein